MRKLVQNEFRKRRIGGASSSSDSPNFSVPIIKRSRESSSNY